MEEEPALTGGNDPMHRSTMLTLPLTSDERNDDPMEGDEESSSSSYYSKPILYLDLIWNLAFVMVSLMVMVLASEEKPSTPLRVWVFGYALQSLLHVGFVYLEYRRKNYRVDRLTLNSLSLSLTNTGIVKRLESANTMVSSIWWVIGFYWIVVGGQAQLQDSPRLYWLTVVFLAFDVFFIFFCIGMACIFFFAIFCCIPIVAVAYAVATRQGASEEDIRSLPKYRYRLASPLTTLDNSEKQCLLGTGVKSANNDSAGELSLHLEDSDCCICLCRYKEGVELLKLPCNHHFHCGCISKWLRINATCPLCKINICRGDTLV